jgi:hypothetical protein
MTVEADIFDALKGLVGQRCYPDEAPEGVARPYIVYQQAGGQAVTFVEAAVPSKKNGRFQITVWADTRAAAATANLQIEAAMVTSAVLDAKPLGAPVALTDQDTNLRGSAQDFTVWSSR